MQDDFDKKTKHSLLFRDYIDLVPTGKINLENAEELYNLSKKMKEFSTRFNLPQGPDLSSLSPIELSIARELKKARTTGRSQPSELSYAWTFLTLKVSDTAFLEQYTPDMMEVTPYLKIKPPSALKQGRKQSQQRRLAEATNTKSNQRTSGLLNGLLNSLSTASKDTK